MFNFGLGNRRTFLVLALVLVIGASVYGFAAANVVPETGAGDGAATISGYTAASVKYTLNTLDPSKIDSVSFALTPTAGAGTPVTVKAQLVSSGTWFACTLATPTWTCSTSGSVSVTAATNLRIVAAQ